MEIQKSAFLSPEQVADRYLGKHTHTLRTEGSGAEELTFQQVLQRKGLEQTDSRLTFSRHAQVRLKDRGIQLTDTQMDRLTGGVEKARQKGIRDSLVMVDELAFIVNIPHNTVVTAMDSSDTGENVFTNINGAVIN